MVFIYNGLCLLLLINRDIIYFKNKLPVKVGLSIYNIVEKFTLNCIQLIFRAYNPVYIYDLISIKLLKREWDINLSIIFILI